jgi:hypothetical protein
MSRIVRVSLVAASSLMMVRPVVAQSVAMMTECKAAQANTPENRQRADAWVRDQLKAFHPPPGMALRLRSLEETASQIELALKGIMMTCEQYREGRIERQLADIVLATHEQTIQTFIDDLGKENKVLAAGGQVSEMPAIRRNLMTTAAVGRQAALLGLDALADKAHQTMVQTLVIFSSAFLKTCWDQSFDDEVALGVERQNELLGTGIEVTPCANRRFKAESGAHTFESCSFRGGGDWRVTWTPGFGVMGKGVGSAKLALIDELTAKGNFGVDWNYHNMSSSTQGKMQLSRQDTRDREGNVLNLTYMLSGQFTASFSGKGGINLGGVGPGAAIGAGGPAEGEFEVEAQVSEKPCKSLDS